MLQPKRISVCLIATGKYQGFLAPFLASAMANFLPGHEVTYHVFADAEPPESSGDHAVVWHPLGHLPWPGPTLLRYHFFLNDPSIFDADYVFYLDVDLLVVRPVGEEIFADVVATIHPGFCQATRDRFTYERRRESLACVLPGDGERYYAGAVQGGAAAAIAAAWTVCRRRIDDDLLRGIVAVWHDESHWNRYLIDHPPTVTLSHEYCCPPGWRPETQKIVIVEKNAKAVRS